MANFGDFEFYSMRRGTKKQANLYGSFERYSLWLVNSGLGMRGLFGIYTDCYCAVMWDGVRSKSRF